MGVDANKAWKNKPAEQAVLTERTSLITNPCNQEFE